MRKWLWLLALPYVVWHSTSAEPYWAVATDIYDGAGFAAADCHSQESCDDLAYAMNEAHERRIKEHPYDGLTKQQMIDLLQDKDFIVKGLEENIAIKKKEMCK